MSYSSELAQWAAGLQFRDLPDDVVTATTVRIMDSIGLSLAGGSTAIGRATRDAALALSPAGPCHVLGSGEAVGLTTAALVNATCSQALEYDDTHNESIVHMSSPAVAAAMALSETRPVSGRDMITAVALGNEVSCRIGSVSAGEFHKRGFHPTGLFSPFGVAYLAGRLLELDADALTRAAGTCGSLAAGILECWTDGTDTKFLHAGWAAQSGLTAAMLARAGASAPAHVFEGRFGLFASHVQDTGSGRNYQRITSALGREWDSRNASFKPFPAAHVLHPYIDAVLALRARHDLTAAQVERIECPVAAFIVPIVCEPVAEKVMPATTSHARVCLQYTLAEALVRGALGRDAYREEYRHDPETLALARRVQFVVDPSYPGPGRFKGEVRITLADGRVLEHVEEFNRGSAEHPMTKEELRAKFEDNAGTLLTGAQRAQLVSALEDLPSLADASVLVSLAIA